MTGPGARVLTATSVTTLGPEHRGQVVVAGSHGGGYAAYLAARAGVRAVILNDAGVGKDRAGVAGLGELDALGIAAATVDAWSARIGDGDDMLARGVVSHVNGRAHVLGCAPGEPARACAERLREAPVVAATPPPRDEARVLLAAAPGEPPVWGLDSASLVRPEDRGAILVIGSHGGAPGGDPRRALRVDALAAIFNDAGVGIDGAGLTRLAMLDARGIAAATVDARTARIGEARSSWETGRLSHVNRTAAGRGLAPGQRVPEAVARLSRPAAAGCASP